MLTKSIVFIFFIALPIFSAAAASRDTAVSGQPMNPKRAECNELSGPHYPDGCSKGRRTSGHTERPRPIYRICSHEPGFRSAAGEYR